MIKFIEQLDQRMSVKTWVANPAARSASMATPGLTSRESLSRHPSTSNLHQLRRKPSIDDRRKLKEQRLAELTRQLELTQLKHDPLRSQPVPQAPSRPRSPIQTLAPGPLCPPTNDVDSEWQERLRKAEEINSRIEYLRSTGLPSDRIPSPVLLPGRSGSQARMDRVHPNSVFPHDYHTPPPLSPPNDHRLQHQPSRRSLTSLSSHPVKSPPSSSFPKNQTPTKDRSMSSSQVGYYQALKEAENLISNLRKSYDDVLERVSGLENQLNLQEDKNRDLITRNRRLEGFLADEQKSKEELQVANERLMDQLKSLTSSSKAPSHHQNSRAQFQQTQANSEAGKLQQESLYDPYQSELGSSYQNPSSLRAELLRREENLQRQYAYNSSIPTIRPEPIQPGPNLRCQISPHPTPAQKTNIAFSDNSKHMGRHEPAKTTPAFRFPSNFQPPNRDPDSVGEESHLTNNSNRMNASPANNLNNFGPSGLDNFPRASHNQQDSGFHPIPPQFTSHNHLHQFDDELPLPPFMNNRLPGNYPHPPGGNLRPQPFPAYGFY